MNDRNRESTSVLDRTDEQRLLLGFDVCVEPERDDVDVRKAGEDTL
jgi:hypothetical protein